MSDPILQFFDFEHLPPHLKVIAEPFGLLAWRTHERLHDNPERAAMLRKLLEAKDCALRAAVFKVKP